MYPYFSHSPALDNHDSILWFYESGLILDLDFLDLGLAHQKQGR